MDAPLPFTRPQNGFERGANRLHLRQRFDEAMAEEREHKRQLRRNATQRRRLRNAGRILAEYLS